MGHFSDFLFQQARNSKKNLRYVKVKDYWLKRKATNLVTASSFQFTTVIIIFLFMDRHHEIMVEDNNENCYHLIFFYLPCLDVRCTNPLANLYYSFPCFVPLVVGSKFLVHQEKNKHQMMSRRVYLMRQKGKFPECLNDSTLSEYKNLLL